MQDVSGLVPPDALLGRDLVLFFQDNVIGWETELDVLEVLAGLGDGLERVR